MKNILKIVGVAAVLAVLVGIAATIALHVFLPPDKAKALVLKQLTARLKREIQLDSVNVGVLSGLTLGHLKVSESPDFAHGTFLSADEFSLHIALLPLLFRHVVVRQIILRRPVVTIVRQSDGKTFNFSDLIAANPAAAGSPSAKPDSPTSRRVPGPFDLPEAEAADADRGYAPPGNEAPPFRLLVSRADIQKGVVHFIDHSPAAQSADIDPLDLTVRNVSLTAPFSIQAAFKARARGVEASLQLSGQGNISTGSFKIKTCRLSSGGSSVSLTGQASNLKSNRPAADLSLAIEQFNLSTFAPFVALPPGLSISGPLGGRVHVKGDDKSMRLDGLIDLGKTQVVFGKTFNKPAKVPLGVAVQGDLTNLQTLDLESVKLTLGALAIAAHGRIQGLNSAQPSAMAHAESNTFPVDEVAGLAPGLLPSGISLKGRTRFSMDFSGTTISGQLGAKWDGQELAISIPGRLAKPAGARLELAFSNGELLRSPSGQQTIQLHDLKGAAASMTFNGSAEFETLGGKSSVAASLKAGPFAIQDLAAWAPAAAPYHPAGNAALTLQVSGSQDSPAISGSVNLQNVSAKYQANDAANVAGAIVFTLRDVSAPKLTGKLNGSEFAIVLAAHNLQTRPDISVDGRFGTLDLDKLLAAPPAPKNASAWTLVPTVEAAVPASSFSDLPLKVVAHVTVAQIKHEAYQAQNLDLKCNLSELTKDLTRVSGTASIRQGPGKVSDVAKLVSLSKTAAIVLDPILLAQKLDSQTFNTLRLPSLKVIPFDSILGDYSLKTGSLTISNFQLNGRDLSFTTKGTVELPGEQTCNLKTVFKLAPGMVVGAVGQLLQDEQGRATISVSVVGPCSSRNSVHVDLQEAAHKAVQQFGQQLLKGILGGGNNQNSGGQPNSGQNNSTDSQNTNPAPDLQKVFKNIFH
ncbi:MAG TPA: AsmA-like C-terminal region-containing protein [Elusimicrobiota bacterium]|nr:AsmA-like C-terminal region-containing protein [Elusimicrobiota bacterium]